jgi:AcrR family transcriptional regulator
VSTTPTTRPARERILASAIRLFYAQGPRGVGVDTVIADSGVAKATFYKHYPRKEDLVLAYLDTLHDVWFNALRASARAGGPNVRDQLIAMFDAVRDEYHREGYRGCAQLNAAAEATTGSQVQARTLENRNVVRAWVTDMCRRAGAADADLLAGQLLLVLEGALAAGVSDLDPEAPTAAKSAARILVEHACPPPAGSSALS